MDWIDALKVRTLVLASLGGGGGIALGLSRFLGDKWLQEWKAGIAFGRAASPPAALGFRDGLYTPTL